MSITFELFYILCKRAEIQINHAKDRRNVTLEDLKYNNC